MRNITIVNNKTNNITQPVANVSNTTNVTQPPKKVEGVTPNISTPTTTPNVTNVTQPVANVTNTTNVTIPVVNVTIPVVNVTNVTNVTQPVANVTIIPNITINHTCSDSNMIYDSLQGCICKPGYIYYSIYKSCQPQCSAG